MNRWDQVHKENKIGGDDHEQQAMETAPTLTEDTRPEQDDDGELEDTDAGVPLNEVVEQWQHFLQWDSADEEMQQGPKKKTIDDHFQRNHEMAELKCGHQWKKIDVCKII